MIRNRTVHIPANSAFYGSGMRANFILCKDSGNTVFRVELEYADLSKPNSVFEMERGLGFETGLFNHVRFYNDTANDISVQILLSDEGSVNDNRTSGALSIASAVSVVYNAPVVTSDTVNGAEIFPLNNFRKNGTYSPDNDCYVGAVTGVRLIGGGLYLWENNQPLVLIPVAGTLTTTSFDETN